jgi:hypothetical protein
MSALFSAAMMCLLQRKKFGILPQGTSGSSDIQIGTPRNTSILAASSPNNFGIQRIFPLLKPYLKCNHLNRILRIHQISHSSFSQPWTKQPLPLDLSLSAKLINISTKIPFWSCKILIDDDITPSTVSNVQEGFH